MYHAFYSRLVVVAGAVCVSPYLRRAPEHRLPAACDDGLAVLSWLRSLARGDAAVVGDDGGWLAARADFSRVFLVGDSSGGNLVHLVAARAGEDPDWEPLRLAGGIPIHPGFVRSTRSKSELEQPESPFLTLDMLDRFLALSLPEGATKDHPFTCPMGPAAPPLEGLNLPAMMVVVAEKDLIKDTEMEYVEAMKAAGKEVEVVENAGVGHSFYLNKLAVDNDPHTAAETAALINSIADFMQKHGKK